LTHFNHSVISGWGRSYVQFYDGALLSTVLFYRGRLLESALKRLCKDVSEQLTFCTFT